MIKLKNGYEIRVTCAAGALAYGKGWWWERYCLIPLGIIDISKLIIITKSLTYRETKGNLNMLMPWRCIKILPDGGMVNAVGMTNIGLLKFCDYKIKQPTIVSISPDNIDEAVIMAHKCNDLDIIGVELNISCPNVEIISDKMNIINSFLNYCNHPVGVKVAPYSNDACMIGGRYEGDLAWITIGNTIKWNEIEIGPSPLAKYGLKGGISGPKLFKHNLYTLERYGAGTPVMFCGGVFEKEQVNLAYLYGAKAIQLGSVITTRPWRVKKLINYILEKDPQTAE